MIKKLLILAGIGGMKGLVNLWRFKREGYVIAEMEFESPLKGWVE